MGFSDAYIGIPRVLSAVTCVLLSAVACAELRGQADGCGVWGPNSKAKRVMVIETPRPPFSTLDGGPALPISVFASKTMIEHSRSAFSGTNADREVSTTVFSTRMLIGLARSAFASLDADRDSSISVHFHER